MIRAKNYQKFSKFVKVTAKILSVPFLGLEHDVFRHKIVQWCTKVKYLGLYLIGGANF